jgi:hypothetical protein
MGPRASLDAFDKGDICCIFWASNHVSSVVERNSSIDYGETYYVWSDEALLMCHNSSVQE